MSAKRLICETCQQIFTSRNKLFTHIRNDHNEYIHELRNLFNNHVNTISTPVPLTTVDFHIPTIYEDELIRIIVKPQGLSTMGESPCLYRHDSLLLPGAMENHTMTYKKIVPCHRLDKATGGLVVCSKTWLTEVKVRWTFRHKLIQKRYRAIVIGKVKVEDIDGLNESAYGKINLTIDGKDALTIFKVVSHTNSVVYGCLTTLDLWPITGRKHQLRKHLQAIGHSILGDKLYTYSIEWPSSDTEMCLWAVEVSLLHPRILLANDTYDISSSITSSSNHQEIIDKDDDEDSEVDDDKDEKKEGFELDDKLKEPVINDISYTKDNIMGELSSNSQKNRIRMHKNGQYKSISLSESEFMDEIHSSFKRKVVTAIRNSMRGNNQLTVINDDDLFNNNILHTSIDEPEMYNNIRMIHELHFNQKKTTDTTSDIL